MEIDIEYQTVYKSKVDVNDKFLSEMKEMVLKGLQTSEQSEYHYYERNLLILLKYIEQLKKQPKPEEWYPATRFPPKGVSVLCEVLEDDALKYAIMYFNGSEYIHCYGNKFKYSLTVKRWKCF